jgi:hypothetical protein
MPLPLSQVGTGSRSEKIKTYNYKDSRVSDHRSKTNFALDGVLAGNLDDCIDTMVVLDQQEQLQVRCLLRYNGLHVRCHIVVSIIFLDNGIS